MIQGQKKQGKRILISSDLGTEQIDFDGLGPEIGSPPLWSNLSKRRNENKDKFSSFLDLAGEEVALFFVTVSSAVPFF